jgi:branched-chain amino acid transport system substrate-binding protein
MKKNSLGLILVVLGLLIFNSFDTEAAEQGVTDDTITMGMFFPLTGMPLYGLPHRDGAMLKFNEANAEGGVNGRKLKVIIEDDACAPAKGLAAVRKLLADKVFCLYGGSCTASTLSALSIIKEEKIPLMVPGTMSPKITHPFDRYIFRAGTINIEFDGNMCAEYAVKELKAKRIALLTMIGEYGESECVKRNETLPSRI